MSRVDIKQIYFRHAVLVINITNMNINTLQISFIFYTLCITTCFIDARHGFNIYSILCPLDGVTCSVEQTCKIHVFISLEKKPYHAFIYMHIRNKMVCGAT